jgi:hypothetical protein
MNCTYLNPAFQTETPVIAGRYECRPCDDNGIFQMAASGVRKFKCRVNVVLL